MPPPYNKGKLNELRNLAKNCQRPDRSWPKYTMQLREKASKFYFMTLCSMFINASLSIIF